MWNAKRSLMFFILMGFISGCGGGASSGIAPGDENINLNNSSEQENSIQKFKVKGTVSQILDFVLSSAHAATDTCIDPSNCIEAFLRNDETMEYDIELGKADIAIDGSYELDLNKSLMNVESNNIVLFKATFKGEFRLFRELYGPSEIEKGEVQAEINGETTTQDPVVAAIIEQQINAADLQAQIERTRRNAPDWSSFVRSLAMSELIALEHLELVKEVTPFVVNTLPVNGRMSFNKGLSQLSSVASAGESISQAASDKDLLIAQFILRTSTKLAHMIGEVSKVQGERPSGTKFLQALALYKDFFNSYRPSAIDYFRDTKGLTGRQRVGAAQASGIYGVIESALDNVDQSVQVLLDPRGETFNEDLANDEDRQQSLDQIAALKAGFANRYTDYSEFDNVMDQLSSYIFNTKKETSIAGLAQIVEDAQNLTNTAIAAAIAEAQAASLNEAITLGIAQLSANATELQSHYPQYSGMAQFIADNNDMIGDISAANDGREVQQLVDAGRTLYQSALSDAKRESQQTELAEEIAEAQGDIDDLISALENDFPAYSKLAAATGELTVLRGKLADIEDSRKIAPTLADAQRAYDTHESAALAEASKGGDDKDGGDRGGGDRGGDSPPPPAKR